MISLPTPIGGGHELINSITIRPMKKPMTFLESAHKTTQEHMSNFPIYLFGKAILRFFQISQNGRYLENYASYSETDEKKRAVPEGFEVNFG